MDVAKWWVLRGQRRHPPRLSGSSGCVCGNAQTVADTVAVAATAGEARYILAHRRQPAYECAGGIQKEVTVTTSKRVARDAAKALRNPKSSKRDKELAGAALEARRKSVKKRK